MKQPLDDAALVAATSELDGWEGDTNGIARTVSLPTFPSAIAVVDRVALAAEELNHHPDIDIRWRTLTMRLSTHDAGGRVTAMDVELARRIDEIVRTVASAG